MDDSLLYGNPIQSIRGLSETSYLCSIEENLVFSGHDMILPWLVRVHSSDAGLGLMEKRNNNGKRDIKGGDPKI